jgi:hypothetical protein
MQDLQPSDCRKGATGMLIVKMTFTGVTHSKLYLIVVLHLMMT